MLRCTPAPRKPRKKSRLQKSRLKILPIGIFHRPPRAAGGISEDRFGHAYAQRCGERFSSPRQHQMRSIERVLRRAVEIEPRQFALPQVTENFAAGALEFVGGFNVGLEI
jgi:hypothetical protein